MKKPDQNIKNKDSLDLFILKRQLCQMAMESYEEIEKHRRKYEKWISAEYRWMQHKLKPAEKTFLKTYGLPELIEEIKLFAKKWNIDLQPKTSL